MGCPAPNCSCSFVGAKLVEHLMTCRNLSSLQCEVCELVCTSPMHKYRHKKAGLCLRLEQPSPIWSTTTCIDVPTLDLKPDERTDIDSSILQNLGVNGETIEIRPSDGFINATKICRNAGVAFKNFIAIRRIKEFINLLKDQMQFDTLDKLYVVTRGGKHTGTWAHPTVITRMAQWISEDFGVKVSIWIERLKANDYEAKKEYNLALDGLIPTNVRQIETEVRQRLAVSLCGTECIVGKFGEIDLVTDEEVIEIKFISKWSHALGQALAHSKSMPDKSPRVHFFGASEDYGEGLLEHIKELYDDFNIRITHEIVDMRD